MLLDLLQPLSVYTALAITAFGWTISRWAGLNPAPLALLWIAGALLIYNLDRLCPDAADARNVPRRTAEVRRLRLPAIGLMTAAALTLLGLPLWQGNGTLLACVLAGTVIGIGYTVPLLGRRTKQIPGLKTVLVPAVVLAGYFLPAALEHRLSAPLALPIWAFGVLFFNTLLCDLRDLAGDRAAGTKTLAVLLGPAGTQTLLLAVLVGLAPLSYSPAQWLVLAGLAALQWAARTPRPEGFYAWLVDGVLFLPALSQLGKHFLHRLPV